MARCSVRCVTAIRSDPHGRCELSPQLPARAPRSAVGMSRSSAGIRPIVGSATAGDGASGVYETRIPRLQAARRSTPSNPTPYEPDKPEVWCRIHDVSCDWLCPRDQQPKPSTISANSASFSRRPRRNRGNQNVARHWNCHALVFTLQSAHPPSGRGHSLNDRVSSDPKQSRQRLAVTPSSSRLW